MSARSFFGDVLDRETWENIQQMLSSALRMEIRLFGPTGEELCPPSGISRYRRLLEESPTFRESVRATRPLLVRGAGEQTEIRVVETPSGRLRFSVPFFIDGEHIATVAGGGCVSAPLPLDQVTRYARQFGVDPHSLYLAAKELPLATREVCQAAASLIASLLDQVIVAVENRRRAELRALRLSLLAEVGHAATGALDLQKVLETIVQVVPRVMSVKAAAVLLPDAEREWLRVRASMGLGEEFQQAKFKVGRGLLGHVAYTGEPINAPDMWADTRNAYLDLDQREGLRAVLATPLRDGEEVIGVIGAYADAPHSFTGGDEQMLETLADYAATAVRNARLYERMTHAYRELGITTRRLREAQEKLFHSDRLALLGRWAGDTAHEMKNTLGGIIGAASTVRDQLDQLGDEEVRELLAAIADEGWRLRDTIEEIRSFSKPKHFGGGTHGALETVRDVLRLLRFEPFFQDAEVALSGPDGAAFVGDRDRVKQVLVNLLRNASEAFEGLTDRQPCIAVAVETTGEQVLIQVRDNGVGIPAERIDRIWEPFYTTKGRAGTGLGLDTVRQIVREQGGDVSVESEPGVGTTFTVALPGAKVTDEVVG